MTRGGKQRAAAAPVRRTTPPESAAPACPHGDPYCPCQDGDACHYADIVVNGVLVSPADPCTNPECTACHRGDA